MRYPTVEESCSSQKHTIHFSGIVQGVGFRYTTQRVAGGFAVTGFVRNLADGRVEVVAEGPPGEIRRFVEAIRAEIGNYISDVEESVGPADDRFRNFKIRF